MCLDSSQNAGLISLCHHILTIKRFYFGKFFLWVRKNYFIISLLFIFLFILFSKIWFFFRHVRIFLITWGFDGLDGFYGELDSLKYLNLSLHHFQLLLQAFIFYVEFLYFLERGQILTFISIFIIFGDTFEVLNFLCQLDIPFVDLLFNLLPYLDLISQILNSLLQEN